MKAVAGDTCLKESVQNCLAAAGRGSGAKEEEGRTREKIIKREGICDMRAVHRYLAVSTSRVLSEVLGLSVFCLRVWSCVLRDHVLYVSTHGVL